MNSLDGGEGEQLGEGVDKTATKKLSLNDKTRAPQVSDGDHLSQGQDF